MNRTTIGRVGAVVAALALLITVAPTAQAAPKPISTERYIALANAAMADGGKISAAARTEMLTRPDLWNVVPTEAKWDYELPGYVPDQGEVSTEPLTTTSKVMDSTAPAAVEAAAALTTSTKSVDRYIVYSQGLFNTKLLDYHFVVGWSYNGRNVVGTPSAYSYVKSYGGGTQNLGIITNAKYKNYNSNGVYAWTIPLTGKWKECFQSTCEYHYPQVRFGVYYNGTYSYVVLDKS